MAKDSRGKAAAGTITQSVASKVVACLAAHTGLPQADFSARRKIKHFAAGGKRRGAMVRALLAWPALKQLGLRQRHFDQAELSGKSTIGDIIDAIAAVAQTARAARPSAKKQVAKKGARAADAGTTQRPVKAPRKAKTSAPSKAKASGKAKQAAPSKTPKNKTLKKVAAKSKTPKKAARKAAPQRVGAAPKPSVGDEAAASKRADTPRVKRTPRAVRASRDDVAGEPKAHRSEHDTRAEPPIHASTAPSPFVADAIDDAVSSAMSGPDETSFEANVQPDRRADRAAKAPRPSRQANASLNDADQDGEPER